MTNQQTIPLNLLVHSKANVRVTGRTDEIGALAASIVAHGLRQNLNVTALPDGRFEVVAGARRLRALRLLAKARTIAKDMPVPCLVLAEGENPAEISLVENTLRVTMHPDDQCVAFAALIDSGSSIEDVAARFGFTPAVVRQRLKLANVSSKLRRLYRAGEIDLAQMMAFAISDDHAAQEAVWKHLPDHSRSPGRIRDALTGDSVASTHKLARFVGMDAYVEAGGALMRDLFDVDDTTYFTDRALLLRLASDKLAEAAETVRAEGWKWVAAEVEPDYGTSYRRILPQESDDGTAETFAPEDMARAGARLRIDRDGSLDIDRGLVHPDDVERSEPPAPQATKRDRTALPATLVAELTAHRTAALRMELARNPGVALAATVHALALSLFYPGATSSLAIRASSENLDRDAKAPDDCPAHAAMAEAGTRWGDALPGDAAVLFDWCVAQPQDVLLDLLAFLAACSINAVQAKEDRPGCDRLTHAGALATTLGLDMHGWWQPTASGFYSRLSKAQLKQAMDEAPVPSLGDHVFGRMTKQEAVARVATALDGSGWLPAPLRPLPLDRPESDAVTVADAA